MSLLITKSVALLILPPGGLILLAMLGLRCWRRFWGRGIVLLSMLMLWALSTEPVRDILLSPLERACPPLHSDRSGVPDAAVIVVLGSGVQEGSPEYAGQDTLTPHAMMRTVYAADLAQRTGLDIYTTGGSVLAAGSVPEGRLMQQMLIRLGIAAQHIYSENQANNTWENAVNIRKILADKGVATILLVTTAWHMPRSVRAFQAQGLEVIAAPCDYVVENRAYDIRNYLPNSHVLADSTDALHEYLGLLWYRLRYEQ